MNRKRILTKSLDKKQRISEIDLLRGIPIFLVVLYHFCWSFTEVLSMFSNTSEMFLKYPNLRDFDFFLGHDILSNNLIHTFIIPAIGGLFIFVSGMSSIFTRSNRRRALLLWATAMAISLITLAVTYIAKEDCYIDWGVIHLIAFSVTLYAIIDFFFHHKTPIWLCLLVAGCIFLVSICTSAGFNPFTFKEFTPWGTTFVDASLLPIERYKADPWAFFLEAIGKYGGWIDWWGIFPFTGVFFMGVACGKYFYGDSKKTKFPRMDSLYIFRPLCFVGKHTIWVYILHQPIIVVVLFIVFVSMGFKL